MGGVVDGCVYDTEGGVANGRKCAVDFDVFYYPEG